MSRSHVSFFWEDLPLIRAVNEETDALVYIFGLDLRRTSPYEVDQLGERIRRGDFSAEERQRRREVDETLWHDVFEKGQWPRAWDRLADNLRRDLQADVRKQVKTATSATPGPSPEVVIDKVLKILCWAVIRYGHQLTQQIVATGSFQPWLEGQVKYWVCRCLHQGLVFTDFDILERAGIAWENLRTVLQLPENPQSYGRERIEQCRRALARERLNCPPNQEISDEEIRHAVHWPDPIPELMKTLMDPQQTPDLHAVARHFSQGALNSRKANFPERAFPDIEDVTLEFVRIKIWLIIKNASHWVESRRPGITSWAYRVFDKHLLNTAFQAINYVQGLPPNDPGQADVLAFKPLDQPDLRCDPKAGLPEEALMPEEEAQRQWLLAEIRKMPEDVRVVMLLSLGYDPQSEAVLPEGPLSVPEIARRLGIPKKEVLERLQRGTQILMGLPRPDFT